MHLRLALLALKAKVTKFIFIVFCLVVVGIVQYIINYITVDLLNLKLGFVVWIIAILAIVSNLASYSHTADSLEANDQKFFSLSEFREFIDNLNDQVARIKYMGLLNSISKVKEQSGLSDEDFPKIFIAAPVTDANTDETQRKNIALTISHTGVGKGKVIQLTTESVFADEITEERLMYVLAHELGHSQTGAISTILVAGSLGMAAKRFILWLFFPSLVYGLTSSDWTPTMTIAGFYVVENLLLNLQMRYEEYYADAYATSLGFGEGGIDFFEFMETNKIGVFPSFLEIFINHPTHYKRRSSVSLLHYDNQGLIPDSVEKVLYAILAAGVGYLLYIYSVPEIQFFMVLSYSLILGLLLSICVPDISKNHSKSMGILKFINLVLAAFVAAYLPIGINGFWLFIGLPAMLFVSSILWLVAKENSEARIISVYAELTVLTIAFALLAHTSGIVNLSFLLNTLS